MLKEWIIKDSSADLNIASCCGSRVLALLLKNRGIDTPEKINKFLNPLSVKLSSFNVFRDSQKALLRVKKAAETHEHITVFGDYDADGVTAAAILYLTLKEIGAETDYYLPERDAESRGLNSKAIVKIISKRKSKLIITVDCGISNVNEVNFAKSLGADVIITDHHEAPCILPSAYALINPKAPDNIDSSLSLEDIQSLSYLAGAGISLKFAYGLLEMFNKTDFIDKLLPLAAAGTIGDVAELSGENRTIAAAGIELIKRGAHKGIQKLLETAGISDKQSVNSETIAFVIAPRLNSAGRLESAETAMQLLISEDENIISETAEKLARFNEQRQNLCTETFECADNMYMQDRAKNRHGIILFNPEWQSGIIGIAASKLVEKYNKPVLLMTSDSKNPNIIRCSCRSIQGVNIHAVLSEHKDIFEGFGGHKMAAGFSFDAKKISFESFKDILLDTIDNFSQNIDFSRIQVYADMELEPDDISEETVKLIDKLQPFGNANPAPLFVMKGAKLHGYKMMGAKSNHLKMFLEKETSQENQQMECIKWNEPDFNLPAGAEIDILFSLRLNSFNGKTSVQLMIDDMHSELLNRQNKPADINFLDHRKKKGILDKVIDFALTAKKPAAVYIDNPVLIKNLKLPDKLKSRLFNKDNIPIDIKQIMFFDAPASMAEFSLIINSVKPDIVHLMNFGIEELSANSIIAKLSGMLKYALSNLNGIVELKRAAKALCISLETLECALELFDSCGMIDLDRETENMYKITYFKPEAAAGLADNAVYKDLEAHIDKINEFKQFYLTAPVSEIKETVLKD